MSIGTEGIYPEREDMYAGGDRRWSGCGVVGSSNSGAVGFGVRKDGKDWVWVVTVTPEREPQLQWVGASPEGGYVIATGRVPRRKATAREVVGLAQGAASYWLDILTLWANKRHSLAGGEWDDKDGDGVLRHDCPWCYGHAPQQRAVIDEMAEEER